MSTEGTQVRILQNAFLQTVIDPARRVEHTQFFSSGRCLGLGHGRAALAILVSQRRVAA